MTTSLIPIAMALRTGQQPAWNPIPQANAPFEPLYSHAMSNVGVEDGLDKKNV
jgi:hypothetical protein